MAAWKQAQCHVITNFTELTPVPSDRPVPVADPLRLAVAADLARFKGSSREHTESDLRCFLAWCAERGQDPLAARRPHLELYIRWMQETRRCAYAEKGAAPPHARAYLRHDHARCWRRPARRPDRRPPRAVRPDDAGSRGAVLRLRWWSCGVCRGGA